MDTSVTALLDRLRTWRQELCKACSDLIPPTRLLNGGYDPGDLSTFKVIDGSPLKRSNPNGRTVLVRQFPDKAGTGVVTAALSVETSTGSGFTGFQWACAGVSLSQATDRSYGTQILGGYFSAHSSGGAPAFGLNSVARDAVPGSSAVGSNLVGFETSVGLSHPNSFGLGVDVFNEGPQPADVGIRVSGQTGRPSFDIGMLIESPAVPILMREVDNKGVVKASYRIVLDEGILRIDRDSNPSQIQVRTDREIETSGFNKYESVFAILSDGTIELGGVRSAHGGKYPKPSLTVLPNGRGIKIGRCWMFENDGRVQTVCSDQSTWPGLGDQEFPPHV